MGGRNSSMIRTKKSLIIVLAIPILALAILCGMKKATVLKGTLITLPISGYDPRDLLSGHYIQYTIDYGIKDICSYAVNEVAYVCLDIKIVTKTIPSDCKLFIEGECKHGRFVAGVEKYFIPESKATLLQAELQKNKSSIVLSITKNGHASIKDLLIDGKPANQF